MNTEQMWQAYCREKNIDIAAPHGAMMFAAGGQMADELARLVVAGKKTAATAAAIAFSMAKMPLPAPGDVIVVQYGNGDAACVIEITKVATVPFDEVGAEHARKEGEGDRSLGYWQRFHREAFIPFYAAAGKPFDEHGDCVLEEFRTVYPAPLPRPELTLRPLEEEDIPRVKTWLGLPRAARWFPHPEAWLREIALRKTEYAFIRHFIIEADGHPAGFCQFYDYASGGEMWHGTVPAAGSYSIDYLIGEEAYLCRGLGTETVRVLTEKIFEETDAARVIAQPEKENAVSRNTLRSAGYAYDAANDLFIMEREHA